MAVRYTDSAAPPTAGFLERHPWVLDLCVTVVTLLLLTLDTITLLLTDGAQWMAIPLVAGEFVVLTAMWLRRLRPVLMTTVAFCVMPVLRLATTGLAQDTPVDEIPVQEEPDLEWWVTPYGEPHLGYGPGLPGLVLLGTIAVHCRTRVTWTVFFALVLLQTGLNVLWQPRADIGIVLMPALLTYLVVVLIGINLRVRRQRLRELAERNSQLFLERDMREQLAVTAERARIAREMHDVVAHSLSVMITLAEGATAALDKRPAQSRVALEELSAVGRASLADARRLVGVLREGSSPAPEDVTEPCAGSAARTPQPTARDISELVERFRATGLPVEYTYLGAPLPDDTFLQLTVFRIVQEGLTNVLRHAPGSCRIAVTVIRQPRSVTISVVNDSGARAPSMTGSHRGLIGIRERAAAFAGTVDAGPTPTGWLLQVLLRLG